MAVNEWGGKALLERAFDSFRPSRLWRLFRDPEISRPSLQPSDQPSVLSEHRGQTHSGPEPENNTSNKATSPTPPQENEGCIERKPLQFGRETQLQDQSSNNSRGRRYNAKTEGGTIPYTDGPSSIIVTTDGAKECLALLLTRDMVASISGILAGSSKVDKLEEKVDQLNRGISRANTSREQFLSMIAVLPNLPGKADEEEKFRQKVKEAEDRSQQALRCKETYEELLQTERRNLTFSQDGVQEVFRHVLSESGLLKAQEASTEKEETDLKSAHTESAHTEISTKSEESQISIDELNRRATLEELESARRYFNSLKVRFEGRGAFYENELLDYQCAVEEGTCKIPQSEFDRLYIQDMGSLTRAMTSAEAAYENALAQARALGLIENNFDQESNFVDHDDDGYRESFEADMAAGADRFFIDQWMEVTEESENREHDPLIDEIDDWDARTVEISDSISLVAEGRERVRIDRWRERCGL